MEKELKTLFKKLEKNLELYCKDIVKFTLYRQTGVWKGEKPTGEVMKYKIDKYFEDPLVDFVNKNDL
jgi:hypothetical protein